MPPSEWRRFEAEVVRAGPNVYLREWWRVMCELDGLGWLTNGGVHMDVPPGERAPEKLLPVIGSYIDNCITPLRRLFAWGMSRFPFPALSCGKSWKHEVCAPATHSSRWDRRYSDSGGPRCYSDARNPSWRDRCWGGHRVLGMAPTPGGRGCHFG
jgi:hypothetical protein